MDSIELINTLTKEEAEKKYREFVDGVKKHNRSNLFFLLLTIVITMIVEMCVYTFLSNGLQVFMMMLIGCVACIVIKALFDDFNSTCRIFQPPIYSYHQILESYQILNTEVQSLGDECVLVFDVADSAGEVSQKHLYGFKKVKKIGIDRISADLVERKIYEPYYTV